MDYKRKYLKYKLKYLTTKKLHSGGAGTFQNCMAICKPPNSKKNREEKSEEKSEENHQNTMNMMRLYIGVIVVSILTMIGGSAYMLSTTHT